jgi:hypothetical protein
MRRNIPAGKGNEFGRTVAKKICAEYIVGLLKIVKKGRVTQSVQYSNIVAY